MTEYNPSAPNYYNYKPVNNLETDINNYFQSSQMINTVKLCIYEVNNDGVSPFLQFLLFKDDFLPHFTLPFIPLNYNNTNSEQIIKNINIPSFRNCVHYKPYYYTTDFTASYNKCNKFGNKNVKTNKWYNFQIKEDVEEDTENSDVIDDIEYLNKA